MLAEMTLFTTGFLLLYFCAGFLVKGSSSLARSLGLGPIVVGLTIVAFGTSAPELVVSLISALRGKSMIAVGNVIGSNICNIALVMGVTSLFLPLTARRVTIYRDVPVMLAISFFLFLLSVDGRIGRFEGGLLFIGLLAYVALNYYLARHAPCYPDPGNPDGCSDEVAPGGFVASRPRQLLMIGGGIAGVLLGAELLIDAAVAMMKTVGVSEKFIGLTVVAFGTSLPELATSVVAALRKEMDISLGNLVGSNVFNILGVLGLTALAQPIVLSGGFVGSGLLIDYLVMMIISSLPLILMHADLTLSKRRGLWLLLSYAAYVAFLIVKS